MDFNIIFITIAWILSLITLLIISFMIVKPYLDKTADIRDKEVKNEKYKLFANISPELMEKSIDEYFSQYVHRYITYKFIANKVTYIREDDIKLMIKEISKSIYLDISELYIFYINTTHSISEDDGLLKFIHTKVTDTCIMAVSDFNSSELRV